MSVALAHGKFCHLDDFTLSWLYFTCMASPESRPKDNVFLTIAFAPLAWQMFLTQLRE